MFVKDEMFWIGESIVFEGSYRVTETRYKKL